jgi:hypothetical protein
VNNSSIADNAGGGISLFNASSLNISNSTMSNNRGTMFGAVLNLFSRCAASLHNVQISGHTNTDAALALGSSTVYANDVTVSNNSRRGIAVNATSSFVSDRGLMVTSNGQGGVGVDDSHLRLQNATVTGNSGTDLNASFGSRLILNAGNVIGTVFCDQTVLSRGSTAPQC